MVTSSATRLLVALIASAGIVGCRWPSRAPEIELPTTAVGSSVDNTSGVVPASAVSVAPKHRTGNFTIALAVFIPNNLVMSPAIHPQSFTGLVPERLVFAGDDRGSMSTPSDIARSRS